MIINLASLSAVPIHSRLGESNDFGHAAGRNVVVSSSACLLWLKCATIYERCFGTDAKGSANWTLQIKFTLFHKKKTLVLINTSTLYSAARGHLRDSSRKNHVIWYLSLNVLNGVLFAPERVVELHSVEKLSTMWYAVMDLHLGDHVPLASKPEMQPMCKHCICIRDSVDFEEFRRAAAGRVAEQRSCIVRLMDSDGCNLQEKIRHARGETPYLDLTPSKHTICFRLDLASRGVSISRSVAEGE
jgi:hypothetical protein